MAVTESRVKDGELTLGTAPGLDISCQVTNIRVNTTYDDDGDAVETLCGDMIAPGRKLSGRSLAGTFIQDWTAAAAAQLTQYLFDHELESVPFTYTPNVAGPTLTGTVRLEMPGEAWGGDVNTRITSDFEWFMTDELVVTAPVGMGASAPPPQTAAA